MSDRPLKIVQINAADFGGGAERSVLTLHQGLRELGHQAILFTARKHLDVPGVVEIPYRRGFPCSRRLARWLERKTGWMDIYNPSFRNLARLISADTDVVHFHNLWGSAGYADLGALPAITRRWPGILTERQNWTFTGHCACFHDCFQWRKGCGNCPRLYLPPAVPRDGTAFNWRRKRRIIQRSRLTLVGISDFVCDLARQSPIWHGKSIIRIYNGVDMKVFRPVSVDWKEELRRKLKIPAGRVAVLLTGQTLGGFREGIATEGFEALNRLADPRLIPVLVGEPAKRAAELLKGDAVMIDFRSLPGDMAECYQAVELTLVTSQVEAFGRIPAESQACGSPVVSFDTGGLAEVVKDGVGGLSVKKGDVEGLVVALKRLVDDENLRKKLGEQGVEYVRQNFEEGMIADQYVELYMEVIAKREAESGER